MINVERFEIDVNNMGHVTNTYIIYSDETSTAIMLDPAGNENILLDFLNSHNLNLQYIILTHCHADHSFGLDVLKKATNASIVIHSEETYRIL